MNAAIYLHKNTNKAVMETMTPVAEVYAKQQGFTVSAIYADGWDSHPNGWDELVNDALNGNVQAVVALNLSKWHNKEEDFVASVKPLIDAGIVFSVAQAPFLGIIKNMNNLMAARIVIRSQSYFKAVNSLNIRHGMKNKRAGGSPFGMKYVDGNLVVDESEHGTVVYVMNLNAQGLPIVDISKTTGLKYDKVRSIISYWGERNWQNPMM